MNILSHLITNDKPLGEYINKLLSNQESDKLKLMVAFAKLSGIRNIYQGLMDFRNYGGTIEGIIGIDNHITSYQAIQNLDNITNSNVYIHHDNGGISFHPKIYIFQKGITIKNIIIGSSNLTSGGLFTNYEGNVLLTPENRKEDTLFLGDLNKFYEDIENDSNTKKVDDALLKELFIQGLLSDEIETSDFKKIANTIGVTSISPFKYRRKNINKTTSFSIPNIPLKIKNTFVMTLSNFDVSIKSSDPVLLIPIRALRQNPIFWGWPFEYRLSRGKYPERYVNALIRYTDGNGLKEYNMVIRLYYYDRKEEFRLQCKPIKHLAKANSGDIITIKKVNRLDISYIIELIRMTESKYKLVQGLCKTPVSNVKIFGYDN